MTSLPNKPTMEFLTLDQCKHHVYVEHDEDDAMIQSMATAAEAAVGNYLQAPLSEYAENGVLPADIMQGVLMLFGTLYAQREGFVSYNVNAHPAILALLQPHKRYGVIGR